MIEYENLGKVNEPFAQDFVESLSATLKGGWFILGKNVQSFESAFGLYNSSKFCVGVASGLDALILSLKALNFEAGSEVIVPSNTYIATILAILHCNHIPVLVEPDIRTYNIDPTRIDERITKKTRAIMVVHLYGKPCQMDPIIALTRKYDLRLIEDCAQSHGAMYKGRKTGTFGELGAFSFYPTKNLGALGDGGAVTTDDPPLAATIRKLRNYGSEKKYYYELVGNNSRLDEVQAGFLSIKLRRLDEMNAHKRRLAQLYLNQLKDDFIKPVVEEACYDVYHIFNVRHPKRDQLREYLATQGVKTEIHYPVPPHRQKAMQGILNGEFPLAEEIHNTTLSLPVSFFHTEQDILRVIEIMNRF